MYYEKPLDRLLRSVNDANPHLPLLLSPDTVKVQTLTLLPSTSAYNTRATLVPNPDYQHTPRFSGEVQVQYNRYVLPRLLHGLTVPGRYSDYATTREVAEAVGDYYGIPLTRDDVALHPVEDIDQVILSARSDSVGFWGIVTLAYEVVE